MAAKLRLILKQTHWSLALKAILFGVAWLFLPLWAFFLLGLYFYLVPLFRPLMLALPFFVVLFFAATEPASVWLAVLFSVLFYMILGIKDFILIRRQPVHEVLVLSLLFLIFVRFFSVVDSWSGYIVLFYSLALGVVLFSLARGFMVYGDITEASVRALARRRDVALAVIAFILWQITLVLIFAPLNFLYQSAILFVVATLCLEFAYDYLNGNLTRRRALTNFSIFFVFLVVILGSAQWGL